MIKPEVNDFIVSESRPSIMHPRGLLVSESVRRRTQLRNLVLARSWRRIQWDDAGTDQCPRCSNDSRNIKFGPRGSQILGPESTQGHPAFIRNFWIFLYCAAARLRGRSVKPVQYVLPLCATAPVDKGTWNSYNSSTPPWK